MVIAVITIRLGISDLSHDPVASREVIDVPRTRGDQAPMADVSVETTTMLLGLIDLPALPTLVNFTNAAPVVNLVIVVFTEGIANHLWSLVAPFHSSTHQITPLSIIKGIEVGV